MSKLVALVVSRAAPRPVRLCWLVLARSDPSGPASMTAAAKSHRRTIALIALALVVLFLRQHIFTAYHILSVYGACTPRRRMVC